MRFNNYIWNLYKDSIKGKESIEYYKPLEVFPDEEFAGEVKDSKIIDTLNNSELKRYIVGSKVNFRQLRFDYLKNRYDFPKENIRKLYSEWMQSGIYVNDFEIFPSNAPQFWIEMVTAVSRILYHTYPEYFIPYNFERGFNIFTNICNEFNIPIPEVPKKRELEKRALYYLDLCDALQEFRKINGFTPQELCAFLYDFAPAVLAKLEDKEVPNPSKVWFVGGDKSDFDFLDESNKDSEQSWQGNVDAKKGDIVVMYCRTPRSYIHSLWRVIGNGFADPFFGYFSVNYLSHPIKFDVHITQKELVNNPLWSLNPLVRKNLQGINGYPIKYPEYLELLSMLKLKGQSIVNFPTIIPTSKFEADDLKDERDVEIRLIEPFLVLLKYTSTDWVRQMRVKMGRGERNYPDYGFGANTQRGEESAKMILEAKYEIKTNKDLQEAYFQAKSYALRLQANCFIVAAKEGIWVYKPKNGVYKFDDYFNYNWIQIENPDTLHELQLMIGKK